MIQPLQTIGNWKVIEWKTSLGWLCNCICGNTQKIVSTWVLTNGKNTGCSKCAPRARRLPQDASANAVFKSYIRKARERGYEFKLSFEEFKYLGRLNCNYCNAVPNQCIHKTRYNDTFIYNGIDRLDNSKGYSIENSVPCCKLCNSFKSDFTEEEFINHVHRIAIYQKEKNEAF